MVTFNPEVDYRLEPREFSISGLAKLAKQAVKLTPASKIEAIRFLRSVLVIDLKAAKDLVESVTAPVLDPVEAEARRIIGL